jgi:hypothetical protein
MADLRILRMAGPDAAEIWLKRALAEDPSESPGVTRSRWTPKFLHLARNERTTAEVFRP